MITLLAEPGAIVAGARLALDPAEGHHLRVRRAGEGTRVRVLDGAGGWGDGRVDGKDVLVERAGMAPRPAPRVLAVGVGDRDRFGWLAEKAAECGVTDLVPLLAERSASVAGRVRETHVAKLGRRALETIKQSGTPWAPVVHLPTTLVQCLERFSGGIRWLADAEGGMPERLDAGQPALTAIGPEGGFTPAERALLLGAGFRPVALSRQVLRFETAAIAAALLMNLPEREGGSDG